MKIKAEAEKMNERYKNISIYILLKLKTSLILNMYSDFSHLSSIKS